MVGVFSIVKAEPIIWNDKDGKQALYLHRMAIRKPVQREQYCKEVVNWAMTEAWKHKKNLYELILGQNNEALTDYYRKLGFEWVGKKQLPPTSDLPEHYNNIRIYLIEVNLFEIRL